MPFIITIAVIVIVNIIIIESPSHVDGRGPRGQDMHGNRHRHQHSSLFIGLELSHRPLLAPALHHPRPSHAHIERPVIPAELCSPSLTLVTAHLSGAPH
jgi:hypothetical protein